MLISLDSSLEFDKDGLRLRARPSEELGAIEVFISFHIHIFNLKVNDSSKTLAYEAFAYGRGTDARPIGEPTSCSCWQAPSKKALIGALIYLLF